MLLLVLMLWNAGGAPAPPAARAHLGSGNQLLQAERYAEAADEFQQALRDDPALAQAREQLAVCYFELRDYTRARPLLEQMLAGKSSAALATYYLGRIDLVEHNLDSAIRRFRSLPRENPVRDELYYLGSAYYKQEKYSLSIQVLKHASAQNPRDSRVHQLLARAYQKLGQSDQVEKEFAQTRLLHDYYLEGSVAIGRCRASLNQGQTDRAWELCGPLTDTDDVDKIVAIGMLFGEAEKYPQARAAWEKAVALDPDSSEIQYNLALTCFHLKDMPRAREHAAEAVRQRPDFVEANILYGTVLYMGGEDREAIAVLTRAHELKPDDPVARRLLAEELSISAEHHAQHQEWRQAADLLETASALQPGSPEISAKLALARQHLGNNR
ncbi:MAG TPA: tetratricopeptide repeat protein [Bryobacteraceae bacterium]|nr:tetratricopeptide repeat protein [Bryobacteraceae bacterium]